MVLLAVWVVTSRFRFRGSLIDRCGHPHLGPRRHLDGVRRRRCCACLLARRPDFGRGLALILFGFTGIHIARGIDFGVQTAVSNARGLALFHWRARIRGDRTQRLGPREHGDSSRRRTLPRGRRRPISARRRYPPGDPDDLSQRRMGDFAADRRHRRAGDPPICDPRARLAWPSKRAALYLAIAAGCRGSAPRAPDSVGRRACGWTGGLRQVVDRRVGAGDTAAFAAIGVVLLLLPLAPGVSRGTGSLVTSAKETTSSQLDVHMADDQLDGADPAIIDFKELVAGEPSGTTWNRVINGRRRPISLAARQLRRCVSAFWTARRRHHLLARSAPVASPRICCCRERSRERSGRTASSDPTALRHHLHAGPRPGRDRRDPGLGACGRQRRAGSRGGAIAVAAAGIRLGATMKVTAILASHNRRARTLEA